MEKLFEEIVEVINNENTPDLIQAEAKKIAAQYKDFTGIPQELVLTLLITKPVLGIAESLSTGQFDLQSIIRSLYIQRMGAVSYLSDLYSPKSQKENAKSKIKNDYTKSMGSADIDSIGTKIVKSTTKSAAKEGLASLFMKTQVGKAVGSSVFHSADSVVGSICATNTGRKFVSSIASGTAKKSLSGAAARSVCSSALKSNIITGGVGMAISSVGDTIDLINDEIDGVDYMKRLGSNAVGTGGGLCGWSTGAAAGAAFGPVGSIIGGVAGGFIGSFCCSSIFDSIFD